MGFNPAQLTFARKRRGLTKTKLANLADVSPKSISKYESGGIVPNLDTLETLARELSFPISFFRNDESVEIIAAAKPSFRALSSLSAGRRESSLAMGAMGFLASRELERLIVFPKVDIPDLSMHRESPETAAMVLRAEWGLGYRPLPNTVHLLESRGVRVFSLAHDCREVNAFAVWDGLKPFVFLNTEKSAESGRFDVCHELGHLVLHREEDARGKEAEAQANAFASAFLMPTGGLPKPTVPSFEVLMQIKKEWNVSLIALVYRLHKLHYISDWEYRHLCIRISKKGWNRSEPQGGERETSQVIDKALALLRENRFTHSYFANKLQMNSDDINTLMFGKLITALPVDSDVARTLVSVK